MQKFNLSTTLNLNLHHENVKKMGAQRGSQETANSYKWFYIHLKIQKAYQIPKNWNHLLHFYLLPCEKLFSLKIMMHYSKQEEKTRKCRNTKICIRKKLDFGWFTTETLILLKPTRSILSQSIPHFPFIICKCFPCFGLNWVSTSPIPERRSKQDHTKL